MAGAATPRPADPLGSPNWDRLAATILGDTPYAFDDRVAVRMPMIAEDQHVFPVSVDATGLAGVKRMMIVADLNPIPLVLEVAPDHAAPRVATRIKLDQRTPVRGLALMPDGHWAIAGAWIDAAGGGCSAAPVSRVRGDWASHLGEIRGVALAEGDRARVHIALRHPMDTGFVANIATYYIETLTIANDRKEVLATLSPSAAVSEDPAFTLLVDAHAGDRLTVAGRDTNGIDYHAMLTVGPKP